MNPKRASGVWFIETEMDAFATTLPGSAVTRDSCLHTEFEERLADCPRLAYRVALSLLRNGAEAEDVAQEAMIRAFRNFHRLRDRDAFRAWLVRTAWRLALDRIRASGRRNRYELAASSDPPESSTESVVAAREFERHVAAALDQLPEKLRMVMVLAAIEGYDVREVSRLLGIPEGTVKSRLFLARKQMAEKLQWLVNNSRI